MKRQIKDSRYTEYTEAHVSLLFDANDIGNIKSYEKHCNNNKIDLAHRQEVFEAHLVFLNYRLAITDLELDTFKYVGKEEMYS